MAADVENILNDLIARVRRVRFWLVALGALKTAAIGLTCVSLYIGLYAWIDHHAHFNHAGRLAALLVLIVLLAALALVLARALRQTMTYAHAANHVETKHSFDQQLVAAVEYFERRDDYPYSKALARQLVLQVDGATRDFRLDSTIEKWRAYALGAFVVLGLCVVGLFVQQNVAYFSAYLARLFRPMAQVEPLPPTAAEAKTATAPAKEAEEPPSIKSMTAVVSPPVGPGREQTATAPEPVKEGTLEVPPHSLVELRVETTAPVREATMTRPGEQPVTQTLSDATTFTVQFRVDAAGPVEFQLVGADGTANAEPLQLRVQLKADEPPQFKLLCPDGDCLATDVASIPIAFEITDEVGLDGAQLYCEFPGRGPVLLDSNETHGATSATLRHTLELEQQNLRVGDSILFYAQARDVDAGQKKADANTCSEVYFIEIRPYRQYWHPEPSSDKPGPPGPVPEDLITILEYTRAIVKKTWTLAHDSADLAEDASRCNAIRGDVDYCARKLADARDDPNNGFTDADKAALKRVGERYGSAGDGLRRHDAKAALPPATEAYRLLRQFIDEKHLKWTPPQMGQSVPQDTHERVRLQEQPKDAQADAQRVENQLQKLQQKIESLAREQKSLSSDFKDTMQQQTGEGGQPSDSSASNPDSGGQASTGGAQDPQGQPKKNLSGSAQDRAKQNRGSDGQSDAGRSKTDKGREQQGTGGSQAAPNSSASKQPSSQGRDKASAAQGASPAGSSGEQNSRSSQAQSPGSQSNGQQSTPSGSQSRGKASTARGASPAGSSGQRNSQSSQAQSPGSQNAGQASTSTDARLRMLEAKQKALREQASQAQAELGQLPTTAASAQNQARDEAQQHLGQAVKDMEQSEASLTGARYESGASAPDQADPSASADSASRQLAEAGQAIKRGLSAGKPKTPAEQAQEMAEQLAEDAEALDESLSPEDRQRMLDRLEAAKRLLESRADPQWATVTKGAGASGGGLAYTRNGPMTPAETARMLARQFWSMAIEARAKPVQPVAEEPSDVHFFQAEKEFFEKAAEFKEPSGEK
jgi:hypothetical protein